MQHHFHPCQTPQKAPGRAHLLFRLAQSPTSGVCHERKGKPDATSSVAHKTNVYGDCAVKQLAIQRGTITWPATFTQHVIICRAVVCTLFFTTHKADGCRALKTDANLMNNSGVLSNKTAKINMDQLFFYAANVFSS